MTVEGRQRCADCPHEVGEHTPGDEVPQMPCMVCPCAGFEERACDRPSMPTRLYRRWRNRHLGEGSD